MARIMGFEKCSKEDLLKFKEEFKLTLGWDMTSNPNKMIINNEVIGIIDISPAPEHGDKALQIDSFEVFEKGQGIGSKVFVEVLKDITGGKFEDLYLYSQGQKSKNFWEKQGFKPVDDGTGTEIMHLSI